MSEVELRSLKGLRVLVTGAGGFLGSHLCDALLREGCSVVGMDNFSTGSQSNLEGIAENPLAKSRFEFIEHDICEPLELIQVDYIFNFASPASPFDYHRLGPETLKVGSVGTMNVLELARQTGASFLQASTSECYGDPEVHPQPESYWGHVNPVGPRSVYDESKRFSEAAVTAWRRYYGVDTHIVRIFNTYGPRLKPNDGRVISNLLMQALRGEDLTIFGDGSQTRSFCFVSDLIDGILRLAKSDEHEPVNIGNPVEWTILECAKAVMKLTGSKSEIRHLELPQDDPTRRKPDITRARTLLGWEPKIQLEEGLRLCLEYFQSHVTASSLPPQL